jgi:hypothetical protein
MEWQCVWADEWVFGVKVRGMVRHPRGEIYNAKDTGRWRWLAYDDSGAEVVSGDAFDRVAAAAEVENALGIKD